MGGDLTLGEDAAYARLLRVLLQLHGRTETPLRAWVARTPWVGCRLEGVALPERTHLYAADLQDLGAAAEPALPDPPYDDAGGLGALYLLAGSTKGARALRTRLPDHVGPSSRRGLDDASSPASRRLWPAVHRVLGEPLGEEQPSIPLDLAADAADRAMALFADLHALSGVTPHAGAPGPGPGLT